MFVFGRRGLLLGGFLCQSVILLLLYYFSYYFMWCPKYNNYILVIPTHPTYGLFAFDTGALRPVDL